MNETTTRVDLNVALAGLLDKYAVEPTEPWQFAADGRTDDRADNRLMLAPGESLAETELSARTVPLLAWRQQRRFMELKRLVNDQTITPLLMCRFACLTDGRQLPLRSILYHELDLVQWLSGVHIVTLCATMTEEHTANVIVRLANGVIGSVEAAATLPPGTGIQDRHELIARRGVASDRVVDTQIGQSSIYAWTAAGDRQYTDVDAELFGLDIEQAALVRSAFEVLSQPDRIAHKQAEHRRLRQLVELAFESDRRRERLPVQFSVPES